MAGKRLTKKAKLEAIAGSGGLLVDIAAAAGVHRATVREWRDRDRDIAEAIQQEREGTVDKAERVIIDALDAGDVNAAKYVLSTLGKDRGYTTRQEVDANVEAKRDSVVIYLPDNGRALN